MLRDVGMAVTRQDRTFKDYTSNPILTSILIAILFAVIIAYKG